MPSPTPQPTLYDRLGGVYSIAVVVDDFINRIMADPRLNANPAVDEAHHKVPPAGFKYLVTEMVCWAMAQPAGSSTLERKYRAPLRCGEFGSRDSFPPDRSLRPSSQLPSHPPERLAPCASPYRVSRSTS